MATPLVPANVPRFLPSLSFSLSCSLSDLFSRAWCPVPALGFAQLEGSMSSLWKGGPSNKLLLNILLPLSLISVPSSNAPVFFDLHVISQWVPLSPEPSPQPVPLFVPFIHCTFRLLALKCIFYWTKGNRFLHNILVRSWSALVMHFSSRYLFACMLVFFT